jgi:hypothetical protein
MPLSTEVLYILAPSDSGRPCVAEPRPNWLTAANKVNSWHGGWNQAMKSQAAGEGNPCSLTFPGFRSQRQQLLQPTAMLCSTTDCGTRKKRSK